MAIRRKADYRRPCACRSEQVFLSSLQITGRAGEKDIVGGLKMANGENPKGYGKNRQQAPFSRMNGVSTCPGEISRQRMFSLA